MQSLGLLARRYTVIAAPTDRPHPEPNRAIGHSIETPTARSSPAPTTPDWRALLPFITLIALLAGTALLYWPGLAGPFLDHLSNLPSCKIEALTLGDLQQQLFRTNAPYPGSRGLGWVSFALTDWFSDGAPRAYKLHNLALHIANGLLVFWLLRRWLAKRPPQGIDLAPAWLALAVTAFWLLHPLQVSTVLYAVQRLVLLTTLFSLLALVSYTEGRLLARARPRLGTTLAVGGVACFTLLGLLSKELAALTPMLILLLELFVFRWEFARGSAASLPRRIMPLIILVPIVAGLLFAATHAGSLFGEYSNRPFTMPERLMTQMHVLAFYLSQILVPLPANMSLFHDTYPVTRTLDLPTVLLAGGYLLAMLGAVLLRRRAPWLGFAVLWFFVCHALESSILNLELVFEHRNYLALLGPALLVVLGVARLTQADNLRPLRPIALAALLALLAFNTRARVMVWGDEALFYHAEYAAQPNSPRVLAGMINLSFNAGDPALAQRFADELAAVRPDDVAPPLVRLLLHCPEASVPSALVERAVAQLRANSVEHFATNVLGNLITAHVDDKCRAMTAATLESLLVAAYQGSARSILHRCAAAEMLALFRVSDRGLPAAEDSIRQALTDCGKANQAEVRGLVSNLCILASNRSVLPKMVATLSITGESSGQPITPHDLPRWVQQRLETGGTDAPSAPAPQGR